MSDSSAFYAVLNVLTSTFYNLIQCNVASGFACRHNIKISGGDSLGDPPVPIPNTEVKP